ncbi:MAG: response regulator receiver [Gemmatimonadetes bacterium]|nr:response regulator receiver [Gemmatimonadota bacterium]
MVEDNDLVSGALRVLFEETGRRVTVAGTAAAAVSAATRENVDLMLLDLTLPDGDGLGALEELRVTHHLPRITVALTGRDEPAVSERCRAAGCTDVLLKPVPLRELLRRSAEWLD